MCKMSLRINELVGIMLGKPTDLPEICVIHFVINKNVPDFDHYEKFRQFV